MTVPRDRVSFGHHTFPFFGLQEHGREVIPLPLLPIRIRAPAGRYGRAFNAILDTGSTTTLIPSALAQANGIPRSDRSSNLRVVGGVTSTFEADLDLAIVDARVPEISCWEMAGVPARVAGNDDLDSAVVGWDILGLFEMILDRQANRISLRLH